MMLKRGRKYQMDPMATAPYMQYYAGIILHSGPSDKGLSEKMTQQPESLTFKIPFP